MGQRVKDGSCAHQTIAFLVCSLCKEDERKGEVKGEIWKREGGKKSRERFGGFRGERERERERVRVNEGEIERWRK